MRLRLNVIRRLLHQRLSVFFRVCPRSGALIRPSITSRWKFVLFPLIGLLSLIWYVVRVLPKPSRATYPCQQVAAPLAWSFVVWLLGMGGATLAFRNARERYKRSHYVISALSLCLGLMSVGWIILNTETRVQADYQAHTPNQPIGTARGLQPGRVIWTHDPAVTDWQGPNSDQMWYEHVNQEIANSLLSNALQGYTDESSETTAWDAIFGHFNGDASGYASGEKIFIKINLTTAHAASTIAACVADDYSPQSCLVVTDDSIANSPQLMHALLSQLVGVVGVAESDITIGDPTGLFVNFLYEPLHDDFPNVHYLDNRGTLGRTATQFSNVPFYWSTTEANGATQDYLPTAISEATYIINFAVLKSHDLAGFTANAKNHYGSLWRTPQGILLDAPNEMQSPHGYNGYYDIHSKTPGYSASEKVTRRYRPLVDLMGHQDIGGKTILYLIDGIFGGENWNSIPSKWSVAPFYDDWPSSLFLSMDPVAMESVAFDFVSQQWPLHALKNEGVQDFMHEAALANNPPSGTFYDPERDDARMPSLGVHEHWNNPQEKKYSRNLETGNGIELKYLPAIPTAVDVTITADDLDLLLSWTHIANNQGYEVHQSSSPYFIPSEDTVVSTIIPPVSTYLDNQNIGAVGENAYYLIRSIGSGPPADSTPIGKFNFDLVSP